MGNLSDKLHQVFERRHDGEGFVHPRAGVVLVGEFVLATQIVAFRQTQILGILARCKNKMRSFMAEPDAGIESTKCFNHTSDSLTVIHNVPPRNLFLWGFYGHLQTQSLQKTKT